MPSFFAPSSNSLLSFTVYPNEIGYTLVKSVFVCFLLRIPVGVKKCRPLLPSFSSRSSASASFSQSWTPLYARKSERFHKRLRILECWLPLLPFMCGLDAFSCMLLTSDKRYLQQSNSPRNLSEISEFHWQSSFCWSWIVKDRCRRPCPPTTSVDCRKYQRLRTDLTLIVIDSLLLKRKFWILFQLNYQLFTFN